MDTDQKSALETLITDKADEMNSFFAMHHDARIYKLKDDIQFIKIDDDHYYLTYQALGKGAQGAVYKALPVKSFENLPLELEDTEVAIKFNDYSEQGHGSQRNINKSIQEAEAQNELLTEINVSQGYTVSKQHKTVMVEQIDGQMAEKEMFIQEGISIIPLYSGHDLSKEAHKDSFSYGSFSQVSMALQLIDEVRELHQKNIIHKDIKPANVLWDTETGIVKLVDFDSAVRLKADEETIKTSDSSDKDYMAPESLTAERGYLFSKGSDVYSVGKVLSEKIGLQNKTHLSYIDILMNTQIDKMLSNDPSQRPTMEACHEHFSKISKMNENAIAHPEDKLRLNLGKQLVNLEIYFNKNKHHEHKKKSFMQKLKLKANKKEKLSVVKKTLAAITDALSDEPINKEKIEKQIKTLRAQAKNAKGLFSGKGNVQTILNNMTESIDESKNETRTISSTL